MDLLRDVKRKQLKIKIAIILVVVVLLRLFIPITNARRTTNIKIIMVKSIITLSFLSTFFI